MNCSFLLNFPYYPVVAVHSYHRLNHDKSVHIRLHSIDQSDHHTNLCRHHDQNQVVAVDQMVHPIDHLVLVFHHILQNQMGHCHIHHTVVVHHNHHSHSLVHHIAVHHSTMVDQNHYRLSHHPNPLLHWLDNPVFLDCILRIHNHHT